MHEESRICAEMAEEIRTDTLAAILKELWALEAHLEYLNGAQRNIDRQIAELERMANL